MRGLNKLLLPSS